MNKTAKKRYATLDEFRNGCGDFQTREYATAEEAIEAAERDWHYLTRRERGLRTISAIVCGTNDDGDIDLGAYDVLKKCDDVDAR